MLREFEILARPGSPSVAVKRGFCWPGFFFLWIWAFSRGLWVQGALLFVITLAIGLARFTASAGDPIFSVLLGLIVATAVGMRGNSWRVWRLERKGYGFAALVAARSAASSLAAHALGAAKAPVVRRKTIAFVSLPAGLQRLVAIAWLTWKAAFRFRLVPCDRGAAACLGGGAAAADQGRRHGAGIHPDPAHLHVERDHRVVGFVHAVAFVRNTRARHRGMPDAD